MALPKDFGSRAARPLQRRPDPTAHEVITGRAPGEAPDINDAQRAGINALGAAAGLDSRRRIQAYEARKTAQVEAKKAHEDRVWKNHLERTGRA